MKDSPWHMGSLSLITIYKISGLKTVLDETISIESLSKLANQEQIDHLLSVRKGCLDVLQDLDAFTCKNKALDGKAIGAKAKVGRIWKQIKWSQAEIDSLRSRLISNTTLLDAFNSQIAR